MRKQIAYALAGSAVICAALIAVSLATPVWLAIADEQASIGIFKTCILGNCIAYTESDLPDFMKATQAFLIIAVIVHVCNVPYSLLVASKKAPALGIAALFAVAAVCTVIAMAVFTAKQPLQIPTFSLVADYGYSYIVGWVSFALSVILIPVSATQATVFAYDVMS